MPINNVTRDMLSMLPSWMGMKNQESLGAKFLDIPGKKIEEIEQYLSQESSGLYIGKADISSIDILYKVFIISDILDFTSLEILGFVRNQDGSTTQYTIEESTTIYDFYSGNGVHKAIIDAEKRLCYLRQKYDYITIQGSIHYDIVLHHVWNCFDELGLLVGCPRLFGENNILYRERILDVFRRPGSPSKDGLINALSRELDIPSEDVDVSVLSDTAYKDTLLNDDGSPSETLIRYANKINEVMSSTWGSALWDRGYWSALNEDNLGLDYLPHVWDASTTGWAETDFQSGVGYDEDLLVEAPSRESDTQAFNYRVGLAGIKYDQQEVYPSHTLKFKVIAEGTIVSDTIIPEEYYYTIVASPKIPLIFKVKAEQNFKQRPTTAFDGTVYNMSQYSGLSDTVKKSSYIVSDSNKIEVVNGQSIPNPVQRYIEVKVDMTSNENRTESPMIDDITISWTTSTGVSKTVKIDTQDGEGVVANAYFVGFNSNTWLDVNPVIRVENDDSNINVTAGGSMTLGYGDYYKVIDTAGDWNRSNAMTNIVVTDDGDLKLSI